jgi:signal transduction histidine kinase
LAGLEGVKHFTKPSQFQNYSEPAPSDLETTNSKLETWLMRWSIRYRLFVPLGLLLLGVVGISVWGALASARHAEQRIARQIQSVTDTLAAANLTLTQRILEQMKGLSGAEYVAVGVEGERIGSTFQDRSAPLPSEVVAQPVESAERLGISVEVEGQRYRCRRLPRQAGGDLFIFYPESSLNEAINDAVRPSLVFGIFGGLAAVLLMLLIGQRLVNRIRELERRTRQIAGGDFSPMPLPKSNDELHDLSRSVNDMAGRLAQLQETMQKTERLRLLGQLSSGLAHQLRNAVTGAKLAVQLHADECPLADTEALQVTLRQLNLMEANLRRFMELGKHDPRQRERHSIAAIIEDVLELLGPQARHNGIDLLWTPPKQVLELDADVAQLRDLFLNVIGNAIEATGQKGIVEVSATLDDGPPRRAIVDVCDIGPGPPPQVRERLFEPFVTGRPEGIGLGLAVARLGAEAHGGNIEWSREGGRTRFRIVLPIVGG